MQFLSPIIYFFIMPFTWLLIGILVWAFVKRPKIKKIARIFTIVVALFFSNSVIVSEAYKLWEIPTVNKSEIGHYDVGIVLGGMFRSDKDANRLIPAFSADRIWQAIDLYYAGKIDKIAIIGQNGNGRGDWNDESVELKRILVDWGIPENDIIVEDKSRNTYENAQFTKALFDKEYPEFNSFLLITSARHVRRAKACFDKAGLETTSFSTDPSTRSERIYSWQEFIIPSISPFSSWFVLIKEMVGYIGYKLAGRI